MIMVAILSDTCQWQICRTHSNLVYYSILCSEIVSITDKFCARIVYGFFTITGAHSNTATFASLTIEESDHAYSKGSPLATIFYTMA